MTYNLETMSTGVSESGKEIKCVKQKGGNRISSFIRKKTREVATFIDTFMTELKKHNKTMEKLWNTVEISTLSLLETQFAAHAHNKQSLVYFFISIN